MGMAELSRELGSNVGYMVWRLSMRWRAAMDQALDPLGLTQAQYSVLAPLYGMTRSDGPGPSQRELADATGLDVIYVSKLVRALERAGLVSRRAHPADPRAIELTLTPEGITTAKRALPVVRKLRDELTASLGGNDGAETAQLAALLRSLLE